MGGQCCTLEFIPDVHSTSGESKTLAVIREENARSRWQKARTTVRTGFTESSPTRPDGILLDLKIRSPRQLAKKISDSNQQGDIAETGIRQFKESSITRTSTEPQFSRRTPVSPPSEDSVPTLAGQNSSFDRGALDCALSKNDPASPIGSKSEEDDYELRRSSTRIVRRIHSESTDSDFWESTRRCSRQGDMAESATPTSAVTCLEPTRRCSRQGDMAESATPKSAVTWEVTSKESLISWQSAESRFSWQTPVSVPSKEDITTDGAFSKADRTMSTSPTSPKSEEGDHALVRTPKQIFRQAESASNLPTSGVAGHPEGFVGFCAFSMDDAASLTSSESEEGDHELMRSSTQIFRRIPSESNLPTGGVAGNSEGGRGSVHDGTPSDGGRFSALSMDDAASLTGSESEEGDYELLRSSTQSFRLQSESNLTSPKTPNSGARRWTLPKVQIFDSSTSAIFRRRAQSDSNLLTSGVAGKPEGRRGSVQDSTTSPSNGGKEAGRRGSAQDGTPSPSSGGLRRWTFQNAVPTLGPDDGDWSPIGRILGQGRRSSASSSSGPRKSAAAA